MKKQTIIDTLSILTGENTSEETKQAVIEALTAEINRGVEKAQANKDAYEAVHDIIVGALDSAPATATEIFEAIEDDLPAGFGKGKVQWALSHLWQDEVVIIPGKPNTYRRA